MAFLGAFFLLLLLVSTVHVFPNFFVTGVEGYRDYPVRDYKLLGSGHHRSRHQQPHDYHVRKFEAFKVSLAARRTEESLISSSPPFDPPPRMSDAKAREYHVTAYGADPTGRNDSTGALLKAFADASKPPSDGGLIAGISNVGGARINLDGGIYLISHPLRFPSTGLGNIVIHGGTLKASATFPTEGYLIELSTTSPPPSSRSEKIPPDASPAAYSYEYITFRDLLLDAAFRGGGLAVVNSLRTAVDNLYVTHFTTDGILVRSGHETLIRNSFLGQHITAGADPGERSFSGTAVALLGNDNVVSDVVVFSAATGVLVAGQANLLSGLHCYNKAADFGGVGVYLRLPGLTQTRIIGSYLDFTGIVAEDPVQLLVAGNFFLGDAAVTLKAVKGVVNGLTVVDNMFSGSGSGTDIVKLEGSFREVGQVVVERNSVSGMTLKATSARAHVHGSGGSTWTADFSGVLLFPDMIRHVQYSALTVGNFSNGGINGEKKGEFVGVNFNKVNFVMRSVSENRVVLESDMEVGNGTSIFVMVDQGFGD